MAEKKPIVLTDGIPRELEDSDTLKGHVSVSSESTSAVVKVAVVAALPATPDENTLYLVTG